MTEPQSTEAVSGESMREMQTRKQTDPSGQIGIEVGSFLMALTVHDFFSFFRIECFQPLQCLVHGIDSLQLFHDVHHSAVFDHTLP